MNLSPKKLKKGSFKLLNVKSKDALPETIILHSKKDLDNGVYRFKYKGIKIKGIVEKSLDTVYKVSAFSADVKFEDIKLSEAKAEDFLSHK